MMDRLSQLWFVFAGGLLMLLATGLAVVGAGDVLSALISADGRLVSERLLSSVGYIVIAVAVFDVAKYLIEEEVIRERQLRNVGEVRRSLTRFIATILIAVFLEAIVATFKVANERVENIGYPAALLFVGVTILVGLGLFQRLTASVEQEVGAGDDTAAAADNRSDEKAPRRGGAPGGR